MNHRPILILLAASSLTGLLLLGCSGKGCGGGGGGGDGEEAAASGAKAAADSKLKGIYKVSVYRASMAACTQMGDLAETPEYLALYEFKSPSSGDTRLGGSFCNDAAACRAVAAEAPEPVEGYSFLEHDAQSGWKGWAVLNTGAGADDQCKADVQTHILESTAAQSIRIETTTSEVLFQPTYGPEAATCANRDAIAAAGAELPCKARVVLEATLEEGL